MRSCARVRRIRLLALLLAAAPLPAAADVLVRLTPEVTAGGGWGSAIFVGDSGNGGWQSHVTPGLGVDVSFSPVVKLLSGYRYTWSRYGAGGGSQLHDAGLTLRLRLSRAIDVDLLGALDHATYAGIETGDATTPPATSTLGLEAGPLLRWRLAPHTTAEAGLVAGARRNDVGGGARVDESNQLGTLALVHRFSSFFEGSVRYRHERNRTAAALWSYDGDGAQVAAAWVPLGELLLRAQAGVAWNRFEARTDRYVWTGASASLPVAPSTTAEVSWTYGHNAVVDDGGLQWEGIAGTRHVVWTGLRVELPWWL